MLVYLIYVSKKGSRLEKYTNQKLILLSVD